MWVERWCYLFIRTKNKTQKKKNEKEWGKREERGLVQKIYIRKKNNNKIKKEKGIKPKKKKKSKNITSNYLVVDES